MPINPGTRLGSYEITAAIGAGGMGEVFRAKDTKLGREVAIKVLPAVFAQDPERLARFEREARLLASLNHTNIAHIYGFESAPLAGGATVHFLAMEMVEGEDLAARLKRGAIPLDESVAIAGQIAEGLEEAHEHGIVHRDLKPANIKLTPEGKVKVLDFGLAKAYESNGTSSAPDVSHSPTMSRHATEAGMIMGTAAYMSPEQARGKTVDKRADIWAFGVVLFEMLTGERLFAGDTVSDTLASVLKDAPRFEALPASTPARLRRLIERCLDRDIRLRLRDIGEARVEIARIASGAPDSGRINAATAAPAPPSSAIRRVAPSVIATAVIAIVATLGLVRSLAPREAPTGAIAHLSVALPPGDEVMATDLNPLAVSADGTRIAYVGLHEGKNQIYLRNLGEAASKALDGTEGAESPFFSPDGQWLAFFAGAKLRKIAVGGAALQDLAEAPFQRGGFWGSDGFIYFAPTNVSGIWRVPEGGGPATEVTKKGPGEISHRWPHIVVGTNTLLFGLWTGPGHDEQNIGIQTIGEAAHQVLSKGGGAPRYAAGPGMLLYAQVGELFAVPWRPTQKDLGRAVPVTMPELLNNGGANEGGGNFALAGNGTLAYLAGGRARNAQRLVWVDRSGKVEPLALPERNYESLNLSPDGRRAIVQIREGTIALWMYDFARKTLTPIGANAGSSQSPVWTADGARIIYRATRRGFRNIYWRPADGSGEEEPLTNKPDVTQSPTSVSPDGHWLIFNESGAQEVGGNGIWLMRLDGDRAPHHLSAQPGGELNGQISPDGRWIAFEATVSSRSEVYVQPFPGPGPRHQVSTDGGVDPLWSRDGRELFFAQGDRLMAVSVERGATFSASVPRLLHEGRFLKSTNNRTSWSVAPDGSRFLRIQHVETERPITHIDVVLNWFEELRTKLSSR
ncbi:MAG TPA: protein kinase [Vicinamibacteria bacterium]|nr:protein kinase [Vicinamibacteria bacterium]